MHELHGPRFSPNSTTPQSRPRAAIPSPSSVAAYSHKVNCPAIESTASLTAPLIWWCMLHRQAYAILRCSSFPLVKAARSTLSLNFEVNLVPTSNRDVTPLSLPAKKRSRAFKALRCFKFPDLPLFKQKARRSHHHDLTAAPAKKRFMWFLALGQSL